MDGSGSGCSTEGEVYRAGMPTLDDVARLALVSPETAAHLEGG